MNNPTNVNSEDYGKAFAVAPASPKKLFVTEEVDGGVRIIGFDSDEARRYNALIIPAQIGEKLVVEIGDLGGPYEGMYLTSVVISKGVKRIGFEAFEDISSLTSVVIPEGVESIGGGSFANCPASSLFIPAVTPRAGRARMTLNLKLSNSAL